MLQNNINMRRNTIELHSGKWYHVLKKGAVYAVIGAVGFYDIFNMRSEISQINNFQYIAASKDFNTRQKHVNAPLFRKQFRCDGLPEKAILRVACVGLYLLYVNGTEITKGYLAPYISNCNDTVYYDEYDITPLLLADADNVVCVILGNGFANAIDFDIWRVLAVPSRSVFCAYADVQRQADAANRYIV